MIRDFDACFLCEAVLGYIGCFCGQHVLAPDVPRCDLCYKVTHRSRLRTLPPSSLEQAPLDLCPDCWQENEATAAWWQEQRHQR